MKRLALIVLFAAATIAQSQTYDVLIKNGRVVDGTGNPWVYADVGLIGDRIAFVGHADKDVKAKKTYDATGLIVAPGFIDMLGQSEINVLIDKRMESKLTQGVTTEVTGEGGSIAPLNDRLISDAKPYTSHFKLKLDWYSLDDYFRRLEKQGSGTNIATFVGATQVRQVVIGDEDRPPTAEELKSMQEKVEDAMQDGALGLSTSLIYAPAYYAKTDELIAMAKVAARYGGIYISHMRNEGDHEMEAIDELMRISREAGLPAEIYHLKVAGKQNWGKMRDVIAKIEKARAEGLDITADQYPYTAGATSLGASIPPHYHDGGTEKFLARLRDPEQRAAIRRDLTSTSVAFETLWTGSGGASGVLVASVLDTSLRKYEGKTMAEIAAMQSPPKDPIDMLMDLVLADGDNTGAIYFMIGEEDMRYAMKQPWVSVGTDAGSASPDGPLSESKTHPRAYGSFARILGKYVREEKLLRLEDAVRKFSSLPAQRVHLENRGLIKPDYYADITVFDPEKVLDMATYENPHRDSIGVEHVFVNGVHSVEHGKLTGEFGGRPLRGPAYTLRGIATEGLRPMGKLEGVVTSEDGYPLLRTVVALADAKGKTLATAWVSREGRYSIIPEGPCVRCRLTAQRPGFKSATRTLEYNGANSLWFSFSLAAAKAVPNSK